MTPINARVYMKRDMTLKANGMNDGWGYFLTGTQSPLDGIFLGLDRPDVYKSMDELNSNRESMGLPTIAFFFVVG